MNVDYPRLATRLFNTPLAITPGKIEIIMAALAYRFGLARLFRPNGEMVALDVGYDAGEPAEDRAYQVVEGVAISLVQGMLAQKLGTLHHEAVERAPVVSR